MTVIAASGGRTQTFVATIPSSPLSYEDVEEIVEALVQIEGRRYPIPGLGMEDIGQEIRFECSEVLSSFDPDRIGPNPYKYLQVCVRNRLYNMRRGVYVPNNPPCVRCPLWDKGLKRCKIDEVGCQDIVDYKKRMETKAQLRAPAGLNHDQVCSRTDGRLELAAKLLDQDIRSVLPKNLLPEYVKMITGHGSEVSSRNKQRVREVVRKLLSDEDA